MRSPKRTTWREDAFTGGGGVRGRVSGQEPGCSLWDGEFESRLWGEGSANHKSKERSSEGSQRAQPVWSRHRGGWRGCVHLCPSSARLTPTPMAAEA